MIRVVGVGIALVVLCMASALGGTYGNTVLDHDTVRIVDPAAGSVLWAPSPTPPERAEVGELPRATPSDEAPGLSNLHPPADIAVAIRAYDWPWEWAERTAFCESHWSPRATGLAGERGLMQIAYVHIDLIHRLGFTWAQMYEVLPNLAVAYSLWQEQGETPWEGTSDCRGD